MTQTKITDLCVTLLTSILVRTMVLLRVWVVNMNVYALFDYAVGRYLYKQAAKMWAGESFAGIFEKDVNSFITREVCCVG